MSDQNVVVKEKEDWMNAKWRPMMGWMYMLVCTMDFVAFPILWSLVQVIGGGKVETQWAPITLQGAGLFHMAMGAIIGVAAFGRTQEKLAGKANDNVATAPSFGAPSTPAPAPAPAPASSFGSSSFTPAPAPANSFSSAPSVNANGQKVVPAQSFPEL